MTPEDIERIDSLVVAATRALFGTHGLDLGAMRGAFEETPADHDVACSIGFTAPEMRGALLMTARKDVFTRAWPAELKNRVPTEREVCDWAGELVNQLLGRVKNALVPLGLALQQSTPTVVTGRYLHRAPATTKVARRYSFEEGGGSVAVYLDASVAEGFALSESRDESLLSATEGDIQLF
jgi:CheY-specific phosphatase CheX